MKLSNGMVNLLLEHIDGQEVPVLGNPGQMTFKSALIRGLIRYKNPPSRYTTVITEVGRGALAQALGDWADILVQAGIDLQNPSPAIPERLALFRKWAEWGNRHSSRRTTETAGI